MLTGYSSVSLRLSPEAEPQEPPRQVQGGDQQGLWQISWLAEDRSKRTTGRGYESSSL